MQDSWDEDRSIMEHGNNSLVGFSQNCLPVNFSGLNSSDSQQPIPWPSPLPPSTEASAVTSQSRSSASSVGNPPGDCAQANTSSESSGGSGSVLKEHDYIGLAEVSSASARIQVAENAEEVRSEDLNLDETDLRLGLGPPSESQTLTKMAPRADDSLELKRGETKEVSPVLKTTQEMLKVEWPMAGIQRERQTSDLHQRNGGLEPRYAFVDGLSDQRSSLGVWKAQPARASEGTRVSAREFTAPQLVSIPGQDFEVPRPALVNAFAGARVMVPLSKNGVKRGYSEAMVNGARFNAVDSRPGATGGTGPSMVIKNGLQLQESETKALPQLQQSPFLSNWTPSSSSWHIGLEQSASSYGSLPSSKPSCLTASGVEKASNKPHEASLDNHRHAILDTQDGAGNDVPPPKGQVVGWPPIRSYRKNTLAANPRPAGDEGAFFVKVNMDGIPVGRKIDLNAHSGYERLQLALEDMFATNEVKLLRLLNSTEFVLTYEDKEGDWMLVGDVPWGMFINTVRRLRIMRGSDGLAPRTSENMKCHA